jgi:predicted metalloprotease with PDZ domain
MRYLRFKAAVLAVFITILFAQTTPAQEERRAGVATSEINFTVSMSKPYTHLLEVEMRLRRAPAATTTTAAQVDLVMPVWTPGSYLVREYARHVQDFEAKDAGGRALQWRKVNKNTWRVDAAGARELVVSYKVYANELTVRTNELNDQHAFFTPAALLMYPQGQVNAPSTVRVVPYGNWKIATGLPAVAGRPNTFRAENFDILYDSPFEVGNFKTISFEVKGVPHRIVINGEGNYDPERMRRDVQKVVEAAVQLMGGEIPYRDYTFILNLRSSGGGGLEHLNSTALIWPRFNLRSASSWQNFLSLVAHEYYHLWNVKRIRPDALGPFDYTQENYTRLLWVAEGITSYYENIILVKAGLMTDAEFLAGAASGIQDLQNRPGRFETSVEEASFDAWIKYYRQDENSVNNQISYYDKGGIVGMLLDLEIRKLSKGARSLDDVMRYLYTEFFKKGRNYTPEDFQRASEMAAGSSLETFFARYVRGREELDYNAALAAASLRLDTTGISISARAPAERPYFGATLVQDGTRLMVRNVREGTPAYDQGINSGDEIVALDNVRVNLESFDARLAEKKPGDKITLTVFRFDDLRTFEIKLGGRVVAPYRIVPLPNATPEQRKIYQDWLSAALP